MYNLNQNQEQIINNLLDSLVAYINEFDNNIEFQRNTTESGGVTPHVAKELHDNIKRAFKIGGKDYGSDMCCFSKYEIQVLEQGTDGKYVTESDLKKLGLKKGNKMNNFTERLRKCFDKINFSSPAFGWKKLIMVSHIL